MKKALILILIGAMFTSCRLTNPSQMLRTGKEDISRFNDSIIQAEYRIAPNDRLSLMVFTNEGEKLLDPLSIGAGTQNLISGVEYLVEFDGQVNLPIIGRITMSGLTLRQAEDTLEMKYSLFFNKPFVRLEITNNRVIVFNGDLGSEGHVVALQNSNTTLFEALALAGGIGNGRAHKVKLIRGDLRDPQVYVIDLSTVEGMKEANLILQANDIIYVEPRRRVAEKIVQGIAPYLTMLSTVLLIYGIFK